MMLPMVSRFRTPRRRPSTTSNDSDMGNQHSAESDSPEQEEEYNPSLEDVLKTRYILRWKTTPEGLPAEIVDIIIDSAEYWPSVEVATNDASHITQDKDRVVVRTTPLCYDASTLGDSPRILAHRTAHPCRKIVFSISSHDQGFGGGGPRGSFTHSYTWFDTELVRSAHLSTTSESSLPEADDTGIRFRPGDQLLLPSQHKLQSNRTAIRDTQHYRVIWHHLDNLAADSPEAQEIEVNQGRGRATLDGSLVRSLQVGDAISVWARARFGAWVNYVERVSVRVFWAV
ncbi:hypothetical protein BDV25DRAFT_153494 [Aspergillus avenaceus]|uniref:Uncharacterized protein n=1 Tax=Aspergillus avenaceus TaxID=36643 RepID=A0A5N6TX73_ASPAV|nr:hypothetical protein BDV25DRAFT_153494 [Aspergillus avenaceus]